MKLLIKLILTGLSILVLASCASKHKNQDQSVNDANAAYNDNAQASGLGQESSFGESDQNSRGFPKRIYYFDFDSNNVHDIDKPAIAANANYLVTHSNVSVRVEGHTDPRGSREYNIGLGERRAKAVADILTAKGVNPAQIHLVSYGAEKLATPGHTESDYQQDRRVVLVYFNR